MPGQVGIDVAFIGELDHTGNIILGHAVRTRTNAVDGLVVPPGIGLGGRVMKTGRPEWVANYPVGAGLIRPFSADADREGIKGMLAVPLVHAGRWLGVLYGADRAEGCYGDLAVKALEAAAARAANAAAVAERARHSAEVAVHDERRRLALRARRPAAAPRLARRGARRRGQGSAAQRREARRGQFGAGERLSARATAPRWPSTTTASGRPPWGTIDRADLVDIIRRVAAGEPLASGPGAIASANELNQQLTHKLRRYALTRREYDILRRISMGETNPEIADALGLTRNTVKTYVQSALNKLGARNRIEALNRLHELGLL